MSFFVSGQPLPDSGIVPRQLLLEEAWGELWDATNKDGKLVFVVGYTTPEGDEMFEEALGGLKRWQEVAPKACPHLLNILEICEGAVPYIIVENPGGYSLRVGLTAQPKVLPLKQLGEIAGHLATAVVEGAAYELVPLGLTPDLVFRDEADRDEPWKVLPVGPRAKLQLTLLCEGRYAPPPPEPPDPIGLRNVDTFSVACIMYDMFLNDFEKPRPPVKDAVPYRGLRFTLETLLKDKNGIYGEPRVMSVGLDRWTKKMMVDDCKEVDALEKKERDARKKTLWRFLFHSKGGTSKVKVAIGIVGILLGFAVVEYFVNGGGSRAKPSSAGPAGVAELFIAGLVKGDMAAAVQGIALEVIPETDAVIRAIKRLEDGGKIATFSHAEASMTGEDKSERVLYAKLFDALGTEFGEVSARLYRMQDGKWTIGAVFFKPVKEIVS